MSLSNELAKLHILHREGGLTDAEFELAKQQVIAGNLSPLGRQPNHVPPPTKLYRRRQGAVIFGVCAGLAQATKWPAAVWRGVFLALLFAGGLGVLLYITFCFAIPLED